jgi:hypothetical protein
MTAVNHQLTKDILTTKILEQRSRNQSSKPCLTAETQEFAEVLCKMISSSNLSGLDAPQPAVS